MLVEYDAAATKVEITKLGSGEISLCSFYNFQVKAITIQNIKKTH